MEDGEKITIWSGTVNFWLIALATIAMGGVLYFDAIELMVDVWVNVEEYGHGFMLPLITLFLIWQKKDLLETMEFTGSWYGVVVAVLALVIYVLGDLSGLVTLTQYSLLLLVFAVFLSVMGMKAFRVIFVPLCILFFIIPLPNIVFNNLSAQLQLISSELGVLVIRLFDISVYLEGNVIDLGVYQLQVVEACSGLRYLFPLMALSFIAAYFFKGELWKKVLIFLSSIPITVFMNSFRIGVIGVLVEYYGIAMAEGFLHDFEGWVVFMGCIVILVIEMWVLANIGRNKIGLTEAFGIYMPAESPQDAEIVPRVYPVQFKAVFIMLLSAVLISFMIPEQQRITEFDRKELTDFPTEVAGWKGSENRIEKKYLDILQLDDYVLTDYRKDGDLVNFYSAFYKIQEQGGKAIHSPRSCIPGGGWQIASIGEYTVPDVFISGSPLVVNRLVIEKGEVKQLVYYWFQQRGRVLANEYAVKWYLFIDAFTRNRTDGALIRLTTVLNSSQDIAIADEKLRSFVTEISPLIPEYVPE